MLFYKIQASFVENEYKGGKGEASQYARKMQSVSEMVYQRFKHKAYCFISGICIGDVTIGAIVMRKKLFHDALDEFCKSADFEICNTKVEEVTFDTMCSMLNAACIADYVWDDTEVLKKFEIDELLKTGCREFMIESGGSKEELIDAAKKCLLEGTLVPEIERIFQGGIDKRIYGNPVHYMLITNDADVRDQAAYILIRALYANGRIENKRFMWTVVTNHWFEISKFKDIFKANAGGVLTYEFRTDNENKNEYAGIAVKLYDGICEAMRQCRNETLTIFCVPRDSKKIKRAITERIGNVSLIEIKEDVVACERARQYLIDKAKDNDVEPNEKLFAKLSDSGSGFVIGELNDMFDEWFDEYLKTCIFPQYQIIESASAGITETKPMGNCYSELQSMIGLDNIKGMVDSVINFYKMQKLYKDSGIGNEQITMHMVFTGNPGTAKTTVARLLCGILKDNKVISSGAFVEVGRADLIEKFVGWTAQNVKEKFKEAKGGVLFVDEAYSLIDDRDGMYGDEAINTIVQCMENDRDDVIVIFAGYPKKMDDFISKNPGLRSRIAFNVEFADYTADELWQISMLMTERSGMHIEAEAKEKLVPLFNRERKHEDFGNGRFVRNVVDRAMMNQASRLASKGFESISKEMLTLLKIEDFEMPESKRKEERTIGFMA